MHNLDTKLQYLGRESHLNLNCLCASEQAISNQQPDELPDRFKGFFLLKKFDF